MSDKKVDFDAYFEQDIPLDVQANVLQTEAIRWFTEKIEKNGLKVNDGDFSFEEDALKTLDSIDNSLKELVKYFATKEAREKGKTKVEVTINEPKYVTGDDDGKYTIPTMMQRGLTLLAVLYQHLAENEVKERAQNK